MRGRVHDIFDFGEFGGRGFVVGGEGVLDAGDGGVDELPDASADHGVAINIYKCS